MQRKALGRGLQALLPPSGDEGAGVVEIPIAEIVPSTQQPRRRFDEAALDDLAATIRAHGVLSPLLVRRAGGGYEVVAGERRLRAAGRAGLATVPALVKDVSAAGAVELALIENLQREDLNPIEEAEAYRRLHEEFGLTQEVVAGRVGRDRSSIANALRLLKLPWRIRQDIVEGTLSMGHARALLGLEAEAEQLRLRERILREGLSVREVEASVRRARARPKAGRHPGRRGGDPHLRALEDELRHALGTRVRIVPGGRGGQIEVAYYSDGDLTRLAEHILGRRR
jgi:ParB family chromosome partitioning protein